MRLCPWEIPQCPPEETNHTTPGIDGKSYGSFIREELEIAIDHVTLCTDSVTVRQYISNETKRFHRFVATRLEEIHEQTTPQQWCHVPGTLNPADDGSRGLPIEAFQPSCRWWCGLEFLWQTEDRWPVREVGPIKDDDNEVIRPRVNQNTLAVINGSSLDKLLKKFSSWPKLVRNVSWLKRFVHFIGCCLKNHHEDRPTAVFPRRVRSTDVWAAGEEQQQIELTLPNLMIVQSALEDDYVMRLCLLKPSTLC